MANTKIKRLSAYEKQRLEGSYKRAGNKVVRKFEKSKNFIENYLKNLLAQPTKDFTKFIKKVLKLNKLRNN